MVDSRKAWKYDDWVGWGVKKWLRESLIKQQSPAQGRPLGWVLKAGREYEVNPDIWSG